MSFTTQGEGEGRAEKWTGNSLALTSGSSQTSGERSVKHNKMGAIINQVQASQQGLEEAGLKYSWQESGTTKVKVGEEIAWDFNRSPDVKRGHSVVRVVTSTWFLV